MWILKLGAMEKHNIMSLRTAAVVFCAFVCSFALLLPSTAFADDTKFTDNIQAIDQYSVLPSGCEICSLASVLNAMGSNLDAKTIYDDGYVEGDGSGDMVHSYSGDAYSSSAGMPPIIAQAGNLCLKKSNISGWAFHDATGASMDQLITYVDKALPVLVWTTMQMSAPLMTGTVIEGYPWYTNEHCVVLYGEDGDNFLIMDPIDGLVERNKADFTAIFDECGQMAVVLESSGYGTEPEDSAIGALKTYD